MKTVHSKPKHSVKINNSNASFCVHKRSSFKRITRAKNDLRLMKPFQGIVIFLLILFLVPSTTIESRTFGSKPWKNYTINTLP